MTIENRQLSDQQIAIALRIIDLVQVHPAEDVMAAMISIMSHTLGQSADAEVQAQYWANTLMTTVAYALANGDEPYSRGSMQ
ncbi:hypothetical protein GGQ73_003207 [Rhizobium skierniewicense]|uniref:Uncharacterized protein n=1 Tax=Rhizobium skierniewicense TaxID=984260 RepID=A0A7W6G487_9HYPH|nr:hypothetical protein [Rhizobium skierniewicense]MBB3947241.1 hypothetical protein [Rhizobium skierniewicense]